MLRGALILFLILPFSAPSLTQPRSVRPAQFSGNTIFTAAELREAIVPLPASGVSDQRMLTDLDALRRKYLLEGYYFVSIVLDSLSWSADSTEITPYYSINEGGKLLLGEIHIEGNSAIAADVLLKSMETRAGSILDEAIVERDLNGIVSMYERIGYPFANATVRNIRVLPGDSSSLALDVRVDEGLRVALHEIRVEGNTETSDHVIIRETRLRENELFDGDKVAKIRPRLNRLNIFSSVSEPQVFVNDAGGGLLLEVKEGPTNSFDGILGYLPARPGESGGTISGMVNIGMRNLFGTARRLQVRWQRDDSYSQEVFVQYTEPWLFELPVNLSGGFFQRQQDSSYVRRMVDLRAEVPFIDEFSVAGTLHIEDIIPSGSLSVAPVGQSKKLLAGLELLYDTRDDPVSPQSGVRYRAIYENGSKRITSPAGASSGIPERSTVQKIGIDAEFYIEALTRQIVRLAVFGRQITTDNLETADYYQFGGATTLRGYREHQFQGSAVAWTNAEYRFHLARRSFVYGFFDTGFYFIPPDDDAGVPSAQDFLFGYGIGLRVETVLGNIGVSIALGKGDAPGQAKLHFVLLNDF